MKDMFEKTMKRCLVPMDELGDAPVDSTYFLRKDDSFVFAEGYSHPEGGIYGKIIYYPDENGDVDIHGRNYGCITKKTVDGEVVYVSHPEQIERHYEIDPAFGPGTEKEAFAEFEMPFSLDDFRGFFSGKRSLQVAMSLHEEIAEAAHSVSELLSMPLEKIGVTGSLAYGIYEEATEDFDVVFYGSMEENRRIIETIDELVKDPSRQVIEFGKLWPMRFYNGNTLICPFFVYGSAGEAPFSECSVIVTGETLAANGVVVDDTHSIYMPPILRLSDIRINGDKANDTTLIIYDGAMRGDFRNGDRINVKAKPIEVHSPGGQWNALLSTLYSNVQRL